MTDVIDMAIEKLQKASDAGTHTVFELYETRKLLKELHAIKQPHEDVQGALDALENHASCDSKIQFWIKPHIDLIRTALMQYDPDVICIKKSDVPEGLKEAVANAENRADEERVR